MSDPLANLHRLWQEIGTGMRDGIEHPLVPKSIRQSGYDGAAPVDYPPYLATMDSSEGKCGWLESEHH